MSWLFDRLCLLAAADHVEIIIDAATVDEPRRDDSNDLADVLLRAAHVPQLTVWMLAPTVDVSAPPGSYETVDLEALDGPSAQHEVRRLLAARDGSNDLALHIRADTISLVPSHRAAHELLGIATGAAVDVRRLFATDQPGYTDMFERLKQHGLGIAIGGVDPQATVQVSDVMGAVSIVDALVTLRSFAFGASGDRGPGSYLSLDHIADMSTTSTFRSR